MLDAGLLFQREKLVEIKLPANADVFMFETVRLINTAGHFLRKYSYCIIKL